MKKKILVCLLTPAIILATVFLIGADTAQYPSLNSSAVYLKTSDETKETLDQAAALENKMADYLVSKYGHSSVIINKAKKGNMESNEDGLYWDRDSVQMVLYCPTADCRRR